VRFLGHDAVHVRERGFARASDEVVQALARDESRIVVSADTDFGVLLARSLSSSPSFILFRGEITRDPGEQVRLLALNLPSLEADLNAGCVAVFVEDRIRIRRLPLGE
jgi:predicted nuclease of predicted toxin-antitoxin system